MTEPLMVFSYDVSDDRCRNKIASFLEDKLVRVQRSVFEGYLTAEETKKLSKKLSSLLDSNDSLRIYAVPRSGLKNCKTFGPLPITGKADFWLL